MDEARRALLARVQDDNEALLVLAERVVAEVPEMGARDYSREELAQLLNGFRALLCEALEERGTETYDFYIETAIPALVNDGQTPAALVQGSATWSILASLHLLDGLSTAQDEARVWLATFFGRYVRDVADTARRHAGGSG